MAVATIESGYNPPVKQMHIENHLETHRMTALVSDGKTLEAALAMS